MTAASRIVAPFALALSLAACAVGPSSDVEDRPADPRQVVDSIFDIGYERILDVYFEPVDMAALTVDGLSGLAQFDATLHAQNSDGRIRLLSDDVVLAESPAPAPDDSEGWAALTVATLDTARLRSDGLRQATAEEVYEAIFDAITADLDPYSRYDNPEVAEQGRAFRDGYGGIGILLDVDQDGRPVIQDVFPEGPAFEAGLRTDDRIIAVDGVDARQWSLDDLGTNLRGPVNTVVQITLLRADGSELTVTLRRRRVIPNVVSVRYTDDVAIIRLTRFNAGTSDNMRDAIQEALAHLGDRARGIVLDLRGNPGGLLDQAVEVADLFIERGEIIHTRGRHPDSRQRFLADDGDTAGGLPLVVLVDGRSASGSEVVAAALQDSGRAVLVGASSYGKGSVQTVTRLPNDGELFLTWSRIFAPSGYTLHLQGVTPALCTSAGVDDPNLLLGMFANGELHAPASLAALRMAAPEDTTALQRLRDACPWREHDSELDVEVALGLLHDPGLFQQALASTGTPTVAVRQTASE